MQEAVTRLANLRTQLTDDLSQDQLDEATSLIDQLRHPVFGEDIGALVSLLRSEGDTACGLNWAILHAIESSPEWPIWELISDPDHEWHSILWARLRNGGFHPPFN